jgi:hypothetical protein
MSQLKDTIGALCDPAKMSFDEYRAIKAINASSIKKGSKSMRHMRHEITRESDEPTKAMVWGTLIHLSVLEPSEASESVLVYDGDRRKKDYKEFKAANVGKYIITPDEKDELERITDSVMAHPEAGRIIEDSVKEVSCVWQSQRYGAAKARFDCYGGDYIADLKSTSAIEPWAFQQQAYKLGYHIQAGWYCEGVQEKTGTLPAFYVIAVESSAPYDVSVFEYDEEAIAIGREKAIEIAVRYRCCEATGVFPGVMDHGIETIRLPKWAEEMQEQDISTGEMEASEL